MKKYKVTYMRFFTGKNQKQYCALELTSLEPSKDKNDGTLFGHRTYSILTKAENIPYDTRPGYYVNCSLSFDKETGRPFAYGFKPVGEDEDLVCLVGGDE